MTTHLLEFSDVVVKRFGSYERGEHLCEWRGLRLLDRHSPGLAPRPLTADLAADPPTVTMSRLPGEPLGGRPLTRAELAAVAGAMDRLHSAVPVDEAPAGPVARPSAPRNGGPAGATSIPAPRTN